MLAVFKSATTYLSSVYYPTSSLVLNQVFLMATKLNDFEFESEIFQQIGNTIKEKLLKYFKSIPPVFSCVAALNPMLNVSGVETLIESIAFAFHLTDNDSNFVTNQQAYFNKYFREMFYVYLNKYGVE